MQLWLLDDPANEDGADCTVVFGEAFPFCGIHFLWIDETYPHVKTDAFGLFPCRDPQGLVDLPVGAVTLAEFADVSDRDRTAKPKKGAVDCNPEVRVSRVVGFAGTRPQEGVPLPL